MASFARCAALTFGLPLAFFFGCTHDFDQFDPAQAASSGVGPGSSSVGPGGGGGATASSSSSSGSGEGGSGATGSQSSSGPTPVEDCLDGIDNDGDNDTDCDDSECNAGFECVDEAPTGWEGYFRINRESYPNMAPSDCPDGEKPETFYDTPVAAACTACSCGNVQGATCTPASIVCWDNSSTCQGAAMFDYTANTANGGCYDVPIDDGLTSRSCKMMGTSTLTKEGTCPPAGGELMNPDPWENQDDVCGKPFKGGGGCKGNRVCVPKGSGDYDGDVCIRKTGTDDCPGGFSRIEVAATETDDRSCAACACAVSGVSCTAGGYVAHNEDNCSGATIMVSGADCVNVSDVFDKGTGGLKAALPQPMGGGCKESGGEASGSVKPEGVVTYCCK